MNHLGHVALTLSLLPALLATPGARVVTVSSVGHRWGTIDLDDLSWERRRYSRWRAYGQSKLANLLFTAELQRRFDAGGHDALATAAHPGFADTELGIGEIPGQRLAKVLVYPLATHSAAAGAVPTLRALTDPDVRGGEYFGPAGRGERRGPAVGVSRSARAQDVVIEGAVAALGRADRRGRPAAGAAAGLGHVLLAGLVDDRARHTHEWEERTRAID